MGKKKGSEGRCQPERRLTRRPPSTSAIGGLPYEANEEILRRYFGHFCTIVAVNSLPPRSVGPRRRSSVRCTAAWPATSPRPRSSVRRLLLASSPRPRSSVRRAASSPPPLLSCLLSSVLGCWLPS